MLFAFGQFYKKMFFIFVMIRQNILLAYYIIQKLPFILIGGERIMELIKLILKVYALKLLYEIFKNSND